MASLGMRLCFWTVDTLDWLNRDVDKIMANLRKQTRPGAIILMHYGGASRAATVAALPKVIDWLLQNGYSLTTVEKLRGT
jgi:peptidoglycan/xylan/chitin deacetylase (PgdA/CDA1 family)